MGKLAQTLLRSTDLSMAYIPCCAFVLMKHNNLINAVQNIALMLIDYILERLDEGVYNDELTNDNLVQLIERAGNYLNLQTIPDYANETGKSYNGVKNYREIRKIFNVKFVIDNE